MIIRLAHINLVARDARALAAFYVSVFECTYLREPKVISGRRVSAGNGLPNWEIYTIWLKLPGSEAPFLEIHEHKDTVEREPPRVNEPGFRHLSFHVADIDAILSRAIESGGAQIGEITNFGSQAEPFLIAYAHDPEGNILELEQPPKQTNR